MDAVSCPSPNFEEVLLLEIASRCTSIICTVTSIQGNDVCHHLHRRPQEILDHNKLYFARAPKGIKRLELKKDVYALFHYGDLFTERTMVLS